jgi:hypothetical protein
MYSRVSQRVRRDFGVETQPLEQQSSKCSPMHNSFLPSLPPTSDSVLDDLWNQELEETTTLPSSTNSDDFEALCEVREAVLLKYRQEGRVIQHRAWHTTEVFRSEGDHIDGDKTLISELFKNSNQL